MSKINTRSQLNEVQVDQNTQYQTIKADIESKIDSLISKGASIVINFYRYTIGWPDFMDSTGVYDVQYLIWKQDSIAFVQKFVNRNNTLFKRPLPKYISDQDVFKFLKDNYETIAIEEILPFTVKSIKNNIEGYSPVYGTHRSLTTIGVYNQNKDHNFTSTIDEFDLGETFFGGEKNLNFLYNQNTKLKLFQDMLIKIIGVISP